MISRYTQFSVDFLFKFLFSRRAGALIKIISWLSVVGIGTGVASLILILSVMNGFNNSIRARKFIVEPHLVAYFNQMPLSQVQSHPAVRWAQTQPGLQYDITETQDVILRTADGFVQGAVAQGLSEKTLKYMIEASRKRRNAGVPEMADMDPQWRLEPGYVLVGGGLGDIMGLFENDRITVISPESLLGPRENLQQIEAVRVASEAGFGQ